MKPEIHVSVLSQSDVVSTKLTQNNVTSVEF